MAHLSPPGYVYARGELAPTLGTSALGLFQYSFILFDN